MVMRDVACAGYVAGCNTRFFADTSEKRVDGNFTYKTMSAGKAKEAIQDRLSFADDMTDKYASLLAFPCWEDQFENSQLDTVMSVTGRLLPWEVTGQQSHESFPGGEQVYLKYKAALNLDQVHYGEDLKAAENQDFISQVRPALRTAHKTPLAAHAHAHPLAKIAGQHQQRNLLFGPQPPLRPCVLCASNPAPRLCPCTPVPTAHRCSSRARSAFTKSFMSLVPGQGQYAVPRSNPTPPSRPSPPPLVCAASAPTPSLATRAGAAGRACRSRCAIAAAAASYARTLAH